MHFCANPSTDEWDEANPDLISGGYVAGQVTDGCWATSEDGMCTRCGFSTATFPKGYDPSNSHMPMDQEQFRQAFQTLEAVLGGIDSNMLARTAFNMNEAEVHRLAELLLIAARGLDTLDERVEML